MSKKVKTIIALHIPSGVIRIESQNDIIELNKLIEDVKDDSDASDLTISNEHNHVIIPRNILLNNVIGLLNAT